MLFTRAILALPFIASALAAPVEKIESRCTSGCSGSTQSLDLGALVNVQNLLAAPLSQIKLNPTNVNNVATNLAKVNGILGTVESVVKGLNINIGSGGGISASASASVVVTVPKPSTAPILGGVVGGLLGSTAPKVSAIPIVGPIVGGLLGGTKPSVSAAPPAVPTIPAIPTTDILKPVAEILGKITKDVLGSCKTIPKDVLAKPAVLLEVTKLDGTLTHLLKSVDVLLKGILVLIKNFVMYNATYGNIGSINIGAVLGDLFGTNGCATLLGQVVNMLKL